MTAPNSDRRVLSRTEASRGAPGWRYLLGRLHLTVTLPSFAEAVAFVDEVARLAESHDHHPDVDLRYDRVFIATSSHDVGGVTGRDVRLANAVVDIADRFGATSEPGALTSTEIAIDTMDRSVIKPFWKAVLGYEDDGDDGIRDPHDRGPSLWFQQLDEPRPVRNRIHLDVTVAHDEADARREAALAAGGRLVSDSAAPRFWVLADADGNEACICTWSGRDEYDAERAEG